MTANYLFT